MRKNKRNTILEQFVRHEKECTLSMFKETMKEEEKEAELYELIVTEENIEETIDEKHIKKK